MAILLRSRLEAHLTPPAQELDQWIDQRLRANPAHLGPQSPSDVQPGAVYISVGPRQEIKEMEPDEPTEDWTIKGDVPRQACRAFRHGSGSMSQRRNFIHAANRTWFKRQTTVCRGAAARLEQGGMWGGGEGT